MKFSKQTKKELEYCSDNKVKIIVKGANAFGQAFDVEGYILSDKNIDGSFCFVNDNNIGVYVGQEYEMHGGNVLHQFLGLFSTPRLIGDVKYLPDRLYIKTIETANGEKLFENPDFDKIVAESKKECAKQGSVLFEEEQLPEYARKVLKWIGKPALFLGDEPAAIKNVGKTKSGAVFVTRTTGLLMISNPLYDGSEITLDGEAEKRLANYESEDEIGIE